MSASVLDCLCNLGLAILNSWSLFCLMLLSAADKTGRPLLLWAAPRQREDDRNCPWCWNRQLLCSTLGWFCKVKCSVAAVTLFGFNCMRKYSRSYWATWMHAILSMPDVNMGSEVFHTKALSLCKELWPFHIHSEKSLRIQASWVVLSYLCDYVSKILHFPYFNWHITFHCCIAQYICGARGFLQFGPALQCLLYMAPSYLIIKSISWSSRGAAWKMWKWNNMTDRTAISMFLHCTIFVSYSYN